MVDLLIFSLYYSRKNVLRMRLTKWDRCEIWGIKEKEKKNHPYKDGNQACTSSSKVYTPPHQVWSGDRQRKHSERKKGAEYLLFWKKSPKMYILNIKLTCRGFEKLNINSQYEMLSINVFWTL